MQHRLENVAQALKTAPFDGLLVTNHTNIYYLTGFSGTNATVFISDKHRLFITDSRYSLIAKEKVHGWDIIEAKDPLAVIKERLAGSGLKRFGFESDLPYRSFHQLEIVFSDYQLVADDGLIERLRIVKDAKELATIRQACSISDRAFADVLDYIKPGQTTEKDIRDFLDFRMRKYGASGVSFELIIASGYRSSMPHGVASDKVVENGDMLTMDFGCYYDHYVSDMTRTIHLGPATDKEEEVYQLVLKANQALLDQAKAGLSMRDFDKIPRDIITEAGYGPAFSHGIGHGIGLDIHEEPYFSQKDTEHHIQAGMVLTDEPGIYLDNAFGVRIEDDLIVTEEGCELITLAPKEFIIL
ncbi:M24 family metallopeptidase [Streptococcus sp. DD12]|uniref:M24 family metallopeptidase n=1 Tax=Streptococcus sp. DD12 TaxID=1777880 RepID=UPI000791B6AE|nr:Xaa-Pro peptidase family protein [Streptococcus sp. DD12]KXT75795.1 Aminopeptidase YpdF (MP-, MA-, MS-, AP-, NP- specific) [Streptococcus sp. DD12]